MLYICLQVLFVSCKIHNTVIVIKHHICVQKASGDPAANSIHSVSENGIESSLSSTGHVTVKSSTLDGTHSSDPGFPAVMQSTDEHSPASSQPHSSSGALETVVLQGSNVELGQSGYETKQLIRVSADNVVTESASRSGWFWSKKSPEHSNKKKMASGASTQTSASAKPIRKSTGAHKELSKTNEEHELAATDGNNRLASNSASRKGDASDVRSLSSSDVEGSISASMQDRSLPSNPSSMDSPVTSTPVRGNQRQVENYPAEQNPSSSDATRSPSDVLPGSPLSYAFMLPETLITSPTATATHISSVSSSQTVSVTHDIIRASRQSSTVNTEFDEARYDMLLREKAGLEGRLEVLERENTDMLQQQTELKQRAAMAEQQIKTFMSTNQALGAERSALAVDLETLRQNRARLEAVIVDAHKLLEEKAQEMQTLERDLELARLAGEKHLEKVADIRREAASRDATVRDLKAKIAELYVQSETSDQSRQVLEGELAAIRADVAALMEAKEWYANQLRATQKDRTRLQQEAGAARAETITANVASERLRAENARVKRNLAEMEQRVLTEKQTLARHLEDIEADMVAREAALTVQLRQANESSGHVTSVISSQDATEELSCLKAELQRNSERTEVVQRENVELSRRLALSQQCVIDRDETIKSLEHGRESAELRAEAAEQDVALQTATVQRLESERSELQSQLESAGKERLVIDQSLQTLRRDTAVLETSFRRMQQDLAAKTAEVDKLSSLKTHRSEEQLSEVWPDTEAAAGLNARKEPKFAVDGLGLSRMTFADKEVQSDNLLEDVDGSLTHKLQGTLPVCVATTDTQTEESAIAIVTDRAEKLLRVDDVTLQSEIASPAVDTLETVIADVGSRIIEHSEKPSSDYQASLELALTEKSHDMDRLNAELSSVKACLSKMQLELEVANRCRQALESEKLMESNKEGNDSMEVMLNMREDLVGISSISDSASNARDIAGVHARENSSLHERREVQLQTDEVDWQGDELQQQIGTLEQQLTTLQQEFDTTVDQKLWLETAKATAELEANMTAKRLSEVEKLLKQTQDELIGLERQLSEADSNSLEVHSGTVKRLESEKLSLQSRLDELTVVHNKDVSRLKSKVSSDCVCICHLSNISDMLIV